MAKRRILSDAEKREKEEERKTRDRDRKRSQAWMTAFSKLPEEAEPEDELRWVRNHPAMMRAKLGEDATNLMPKEIKDAPSRSAVIQLQHWMENPDKFYNALLSRQAKTIESNQRPDEDEPEDLYPEIKDIDELLMSLEGAVRPDGTLQITSGALSEDEKKKNRWQIVPTDLIANLKFRRDLLVRCRKSKVFREAIMEVCRDDPIFFFNSMCWVYEPRPRFAGGVRLPTLMPFIAWEHQVPCIQDIFENLGIRDIGLEKSRGEGASWIAVLLAMHDWLFTELAAIGFVSKDENTVDDPNDPDSLMWKCDYTLRKLPNWLSGEKGSDYYRNVNNHVLRNNRNGSTIVGYSATADVGSGGRKKWFLMDELAKFPRPNDEAAMASTQHVTECRLIISTPKGNSGAYFDAMHAESNMKKVILDWKQNPTRNRGLYKWIDGMPVAVDPINNPLPPGYNPISQDTVEVIARLRRRGFKIEGSERSPWYDRECDRPQATPQNIAQELDRDYGGSAYRIFGEAFFNRTEDSLMSAVHEGDIDFDEEEITKIRFDKIDSGPCKLYFPLDARGNPPAGHYGIGCDVSAGTAGSFSSNSTIIVADLRTGNQMLEYAINSLSPTRFADLAIAIAKWFGNCQLGWEHNGPGAAFTRQVLNRKYPYIFFRTSVSRRAKQKSKEAGWWTDERSKEVMFSEFQRAVLSGDFVVRSRELRYECGQYVRKAGKITHALIQNASDDSQGASHGDRVIAGCVLYQVMKDMPIMSSDEEIDEERVPPGSMAERELEYQRAQQDDDDGWDDGIFATQTVGHW